MHRSPFALGDQLVYMVAHQLDRWVSLGAATPLAVAILLAYLFLLYGRCNGEPRHAQSFPGRAQNWDSVETWLR